MLFLTAVNKISLFYLKAAATIRELVTLAGGATQPHIVCGDFNSTPDSPVYQLTHEGYLNDSSMAKLQQLPEVKLDDGRDSSEILLYAAF